MTTPTHKKTTRRVTLEHKLDRIQRSISELKSLLETHIQHPAPEPFQPAAFPLKAAPVQLKAPRKRNPWNEFITQYLKNQKAQGRIITGPEVIAEARLAYYAKYGRTLPKTRKKPKVQVNSESQTITPGALVSLTPGRGSPLKSANDSPALQNLLASVSNRKNTPMPPPNPKARTPTPKARTPTPSANQSTPSPLAPYPSANQPTPSPLAPSPPAQVSRNNLRPSPATYGYEDMGLNENSPARKIVIDGNKYYMTDEDRALFRRSENNGIGEWVGYLEPGGQIRETEGAD